MPQGKRNWESDLPQSKDMGDPQERTQPTSIISQHAPVEELCEAYWEGSAECGLFLGK